MKVKALSGERDPTPPAESDAAVPAIQPDGQELQFIVSEEGAGQRLDRFLAAQLPEVSRVRVQQWIEQGRVSILNASHPARHAKPGEKLRGGETIRVIGGLPAPPLRARPEAIPLDVIYEDEWLAVIDKPAGMMVHAGAGATENERSRGTLVNALLYRMASLSGEGGPLRPGIVHRLDKQTSGLILVAKDDRTHRRLSEMFARRQVHKIYLALVHGAVKLDRGTVDAPIQRDRVHRTRMTARRFGGRAAISHYRVRQRIEGRFGRFTLLEVQIETGRSHQIRVHLSSIGHPVVGDTTYGAPRRIPPRLEAPASRARREAAARESLALERNFLHATHLELIHPVTGKVLALDSPLPKDLSRWIVRLTSSTSDSSEQEKPARPREDTLKSDQ
jgi:23S rRNA pseudouridine1911/1915/1917 synthase